MSKRKKKPSVVDASAEPNTLAVPGLQRKPRIVCKRCGGQAKQAYHWREWYYYVCNAAEQCVDPETLKPQVTKVLAE